MDEIKKKWEIKKYIIINAISFLLSINCEYDKSQKLIPSVNDPTDYLLNKPLNEVKRHIIAGQQYRAKGQGSRAKEEIQYAKKGINELELFYLPLTNAKAHILSAYRFIDLNRYSQAAEQLKQARYQLLIATSLSTGNTLIIINNIIYDMEILEKKIIQKSNIDQENFFLASIQKEKVKV
jgi:hypothetical protein